MTTIRGMLLDIDGTLLDSNDAHAQAWVDAFAEFGYDIPFETIQPKVGMGGDKLIGAVIPGMTDSTSPGKEIAGRRKEIFLATYASHLKPTPGARDLLLRMLDDGLKLTIATSANDDELDTLLGLAGVSDLIHHTTTADDAEHSKPDPDIIQSALSKSGFDSNQVLMLGDSPFDIQAAQAAGVGTIALRTGGHDEDLQGALAVYDDPADLLVDYDRSPLGRRMSAGITP